MAKVRINAHFVAKVCINAHFVAKVCAMLPTGRHTTHNSRITCLADGANG